MGHALMWIEGLGAMLLLAALAAACSAHWSRRLRQGSLPLLVALLIGLLAAALTFGAWILKYRSERLILHDWFFYALSWLLAFLSGVWLVISRGLKRVGEARIPVASSWPRGRLALAFLGMIVLFAITLSNMDLAMKVQLAEVRTEAGAAILAMEPLSVADKDNAAPLYEEAVAAITPADRLPPRWKRAMERWKEIQWQQDWGWQAGHHARDFDWKNQDVREFLASQEKGMALLRRAAAKPACHFHRGPSGSSLVDWETWFFPLAADCVYGSRLLALDAHVKAVDGDTHTAIEDIKAILGMARHTSFFTSIGLEKRGLDALMGVLSLSSPPPEQLRKLSLDGTPYLRDFPRVEATFAILTLMLLSPEQSSRWYWDWSKEVFFPHRMGQPLPPAYESPFWFEVTVMPLWRAYLVPDDLVFIHRALRGCQSSLRVPEETYTNWHALQRSLDTRPGGMMYVRYMRPKIGGTARQACDVITMRRLVRIAVAITAYKAKHGKYADKLAALVPTFLERLPTDPWDDEPLHMKNTEKSTILYTLRNGQDEPLTSPNWSWQRRDIVLRLP